MPEPVAILSADTTPEPRRQKRPEKRWFSRKAWVTALAVLAFIPLALLVVLLWQGMIRPPADGAAPLAGNFGVTESVYAKKDTARLVAEAGTSDVAVPSRTDVTGSLPDGAAGWSLSPHTSGALPFWVPDQTSAPEIAAAPAPTGTQTEPANVAALVPPPSRKPAPPAASEPPVRTVKVVPIEPPRATRERKPYDGAYALGAPADEPQGTGEWMVTKTAVDMHARAEQKSETVKVAEGGLKVRVTARDKNWIQVYDPESSTTGWIYNRFLKPAE